MQRKEINIFSISFLDLLSGALGAVLILFIIIPKMTFEQQDAISQLEELNEQNLQQRLQNTEAENARLRQQLEQAQRELQEAQRQLESQSREAVGEKIFGVNAQLAVACVWPENVDVDLHVKDLRTDSVVYYRQPNLSFGILMSDITSRRQGDDTHEIFYQTEVVPGRYEISIHLYSGASAVVDGYAIIFPFTRNEQKINFRQIRLTRPKEKIKVGTLTVTSNNITLEQ